MDVDRKTLGDIGLSVNRCSFNFTNLTNNSDLSKWQGGVNDIESNEYFHALIERMQ